MNSRTTALDPTADRTGCMQVESTWIGETDPRKRIDRAQSRARLAAAAISCLCGAEWASAQQLLHAQQLVPYGSPIRISLDYNGQEALGGSYWPSFSSDDRFIGFVTMAPLAINDLNGQYDNYIYDTVAGGAPELISVNLSGFTSTWESKIDVIVSTNGRYVAFCSDAGDLAPGDTNGAPDAFVRDRVTGVTELCSISSTGVQGYALIRVAMSDDGRFPLCQRA